MQRKEVGYMDELPNSIHGNGYHIMALKDPDYVILMMTTYMTLEYLDWLDMQWSYKGSGGEVVTKRFNYCEVFGNHFR